MTLPTLSQFLLDYEEIRKLASIERDFVLPGLPSGKVAILAGAPGIGKSFLALQWGIQLAAGEKMAGIKNFSSPPRKVFFGSFEDDSKDIQKRGGAIIRAFPNLQKKLNK